MARAVLQSNMTQADAKGTAGTPGAEGVPREAGRPARNLIGLPRSPVLSHYRKQLERAGVSPDASFPHKIGAFLPKHLLIWAYEYLKFIFHPKHEFQDYRDSSGERGVYVLRPDSGSQNEPEGNRPIRVCLAADWGTGTSEANEIARHIAEIDPHYTIHLGDIYYVGDDDEVNENCLGKAEPGGTIRPVRWPVGSVGSFALNGNHEMYANGNGYFNLFLPTLGIPGSDEGRHGQKASFFCLQNQYWKIIGLDTGYNSLGFPILEHIPLIRKIPGIGPSCRLPRPLLKWLREDAKLGADKRGIVLLSHHQYYSAFEDQYTLPARQLARFISRPVLWFWGHEHRLAIYGKFGMDGSVQAYGRCIGNGGFPVSQPVTNPQPPLVLYDDRLYKVVDGMELGFNGFVKLTFAENRMSIDYRDVENRKLMEEEWEVHEGVLQGKSIQSADSELKRTSHDLGMAVR